MLKYNDSMNHYDEDMQSFTKSGQYQAMHTRNNEEIELFREQLPGHLKAYFTSLLNHLSDEYACLAEASYDAGIERGYSREEAYEKQNTEKTESQ